MLKRRDRIERLDRVIAESELQIHDQVFRVVSMEAGGHDATEAKRTLRAFESILVEYHRARALLVEAEVLTGRHPPPDR